MVPAYKHSKKKKRKRGNKIRRLTNSLKIKKKTTKGLSFPSELSGRPLWREPGLHTVHQWELQKRARMAAVISGVLPNAASQATKDL